MKNLAEIKNEAKIKNRKTIYTQQIAVNGFVGLGSDLKYSFKPFTGSYRARVSKLRDVNYIELHS